MGKKTLITAIIISALLISAIAGTQYVSLGMANFFTHTETYNTPPTISIFSPTQNEATPSNLLLNFTITKSFGWNVSILSHLKNRLVRVKILIDGQVYRSIEVDSRLFAPFSYSEYLQDLADGMHTLALETFCEGWTYNIFMGGGKLWYTAFSELINFTVYANPPQILPLSITNKTYEASDIPLVFTVNKTVSQVSYSLDGQDNVTIGGNTTLTGLANGEHNITVYATDIVGNTGASETIYFSVEVPFPATMIIAPIASATVFGIGLLVHFKKHKH